MAKSVRYGLVLVLLGLLVIFVDLWIDERSTVHAHYELLGLKLVDEVGIALLVLGSVAILLEFRDWTDYFQKRIERIIVEQDYLKKMDNAQLIALQTNTLKAFFRTNDIDHKDSFLHFFHSRIHGYIGSPYREDVRDLINISYSAGGKDRLEVEETISYRCRKVGDKIQDQVKWLETGAAQVKQMQLLDHDVEIQVPHETFPKFKEHHPNIEQRSIFKNTDNPNRLQLRSPGIGFELSLQEYEGVDDLHVKAHIHYTVPTNLPFIWTMSHPTKGITGTITYPVDQDLITNVFGMTEDQVNRVDKPGLYQVDYDSWLLPDTGFSFHLISKPSTQAVVTAPPPQPPTQNSPTA